MPATSTSETTYPVLLLPFDIISQIFVYCLPQEADALPWRSEAPLLVASICRQWRDVALATHELWNTIYLSLKPHSVAKAKPLLHFWIPRAGGLPLSMSLYLKFGGDLLVTSTTWLDSLAEILSQYSLHWTTIELHMSLQVLRQLPRPKEDFASLQKLTLACGSGEYGKIKPAPIFTETPQLRELHIISGVIPTLVTLSWQQLTTLRVDNTSVVQSLQLLQLAPNMVDCTFTIWRRGNSAGPAPIAALHLLESLTVTLGHDRGPALLACLTLPALQRLELDIQGSDEIQKVTSFIARSSCFLRRLSVRPDRWTEENFLELLLATPYLEELVIRKGGKCISTLFHLLQTQSHLLPNLKSLDVEHTVSGPGTEDLIADVLESRRQISEDSFPVRLESFRFISPLTEAPAFDSEPMVRLGRLRAEGMKLHIVSSRSWFPRGGRSSSFRNDTVITEP